MPQRSKNTVEHELPYAWAPSAGEEVKPRQTGLTMIADKGLTIPEIAAQLDLVGPYIDFSKLYAGTVCLYSRGYLFRKLEIYHASNIVVFPGGSLLEKIIQKNGPEIANQYFYDLRRLGFGAVEISAQSTMLEGDQRELLVRNALSHDLRVLVEVGSKTVNTPPDYLVDQVKQAFDSGASLIVVEAAALVSNGVPNKDLFEGIKRAVEIERVLFELPGPNVPGTTRYSIQRMKGILLNMFGERVNLGNVRVNDVVDTELRRRGLGPATENLSDLTKPDGSESTSF